MDIPSNSVKTVVAYYGAQIETLYPPEEAKAIVWLLLEHFLGITRFALAKNPELRMSESELLTIHRACKKILQNIPVQYVTGETEFCGLRFTVDESVLIPRPETEQLTQIILQDLPTRPTRILDIGVGSGAVAVSLKKNRQDCEVFGCDISRKALEAARQNAEMNGVAINFFECDILSDSAVKKIPEVDVVVSNPPYVCKSEKAAMRANVLQNEPAEALFVPDDDPLLFYRAIAAAAFERLPPGGKLFFEINERFGEAMAELLANFGFSDISILKDFNEKDRFVAGEKGNH